LSYLFLQDEEDPNMERFPFHYNNSRAVDILSKAFYIEGTNRWQVCAEEAMNCCNNMTQEDITPGIEFETYFTKRRPVQWVVGKSGQSVKLITYLYIFPGLKMIQSRNSTSSALLNGITV
jgi:hypothetical protein